jgi:ubiquinone/menaquinone biosynthesis C-methylase UbiE
LNSSYDPYQPLAGGLYCGDAVNGLLLLKPRRKIVQLVKGQRVLDVCCGTGNLTAMLVAAGCQVVGVDGSPTMLNYARRKHIAADLQLMDAAHLPFRGEFDSAVISLALHEMQPNVREQVWASMLRAVRPQGRLIGLDYTVPRTRSLLGRVMLSLVDRDERSLVAVHREHYENFQEFMQRGGLRAWIHERGEVLETEYNYWGGTVAVAACRGSGSGLSAVTPPHGARST